MTTIEPKMKPSSLKSLMYWNNFTFVKTGVYYKAQISDKIKDVQIDFYDYNSGIKIVYKRSFYDVWENEEVTLKRGLNWHEEVYEELLIWLISRMDNMKIPNFDKYKKV